jgi:hypothetical protein
MGSDTQAQKRCNAHRLSSFRALGGLHNRAQEGRGQYNPKRKDWDMAKKWEYCPRRVALFLDDPNEPGLDLAYTLLGTGSSPAGQGSSVRRVSGQLTVALQRRSLETLRTLP